MADVGKAAESVDLSMKRLSVADDHEAGKVKAVSAMEGDEVRTDVPTPSQSGKMPTGEDEAPLKMLREVDQTLSKARDLGNGNTTALVGGLTLTGADAKSDDRKKFFHDSVADGLDSKRDDLDKFAVFVSWLQEHGASFPGLYLKKYTDEVRGVHAESELRPDQQIVTIPLKLLIHEGMGQQTDIGKKVHNNPNCHIIVPAHTQVIIYMLLTMRDPNHFFKPYYDILPREFSNFPIFWSQEELRMLEGSDLVRQIEERKTNILSDDKNICKVAPEFGEMFSGDDFLWCRTAVGSRNFGITVNGVKRTTMVPFSDMLNHYRPRETSWTFDNLQQAFTMTTLVGLRAGQQVMDSYGKKCNSKFLLHYGFAVEKNREEDGRCQNELLMMFSMPPADSDPFAKQRLRLASASLSIRVMMTYDEKRTQEALSFLRLSVANEQELASIMETHRSAYSLSSNPIRPISARNEIAALAAMASTARRLLQRYPTTYEQDKETLASGQIRPFSNRRNALIVILGEKEILHFWISASKACTEVLSKPIAEAVQQVQDEYADNDDLSRYIRSTVYALRSVSGASSYYY
eukprot:g1255.t1